jgi:hypothetical protein
MKVIDDSNPALRPEDTALLPPTLKQREVAALERIATTLEELLNQYTWVSQREAQR